MASTSKSNKRKPKKPIREPKPKQRRGLEQPTRNWLDLPSDIMANILSRVGVEDKLENAQIVCTTWHEICKDPAVWRVIEMPRIGYLFCINQFQRMCKHVVDRSQGQLVDFDITGFCNAELLQYVAARSSRLKRLTISYSYADVYVSWSKAIKKLPLLEELSLSSTDISKEAIETVGRYCPMLKTLKLNRLVWCTLIDDCDEICVAIGENLHELQHLQLIGGIITDIGLKVILDGCGHLESLDLLGCRRIDIKGDLRKRCLEQIKCVRLPGDSSRLLL